MTTIPRDTHYPLHDYLEKRDSQPPRRHVPAIPDFRFEWSYLRSVRPCVQVERLDPASHSTDEKGKGVLRLDEPMLPAERIRVQWGRLLWVTTRDQVLSPFAQGAAWGIAAFYLKPLLAAFGSSIRAWWARGGTSDPRRRIEGEGVSWLRNWVSSVTKPNVQSVAAK